MFWKKKQEAKPARKPIEPVPMDQWGSGANIAHKHLYTPGPQPGTYWVNVGGTIKLMKLE